MEIQEEKNYITTYSEVLLLLDIMMINKISLQTCTRG